MTAMTVICFALAAVLAAAGCIKADRVRAWRHGFNPSAEELPSSAFVAGRAIFFFLAGIMAFQGFQLLAVSDDVSWSDSELTTAVQGATTALDARSYFEIDSVGNDIKSMIEDEVVQHGGGDAPQSGVDAFPADTNTATDADYTIKADGAKIAFCMHVKRTESKDGGYTPPGVAGGEGTVTIPEYELAATVDEGEC
ncbi:hypothetical protein AB0D78_43755 [Streptomyces avermitilis]|uniref:hypothetical protein n=1 Tax=Streptomyces avermitilis TaxID=33903 RepID=UPI003406827B